MHAALLLDPTLGLDTPAGAAARVEYQEWHIWLWDWITAGAAILYWSMWRKFPGLVSGAALYEDLRERQRRALEIHDHIVQGLVQAKLSLDLDAQAEGEQAIVESLQASKKIITELLGDQSLLAGSLRRAKPAQ